MNCLTRMVPNASIPLALLALIYSLNSIRVFMPPLFECMLDEVVAKYVFVHVSTISLSIDVTQCVYAISFALSKYQFTTLSKYWKTSYRLYG